MNDLANRLRLEPCTDAHLPFLKRVYASTRADELALTGWPDEQKETFITFQFEAQHTYYHEHWPDADYDLIVLDGQPVGRLYVDRRADEIRIMDIALLPEYRRQGIGTYYMKGIIAEAHGQGLPVRLHVEGNNPAMSLYHELGFKRIGESGVYYFMECVKD